MKTVEKTKTIFHLLIMINCTQNIFCESTIEFNDPKKFELIFFLFGYVL